MNDKNEAKETIKRVERIIWEWEENWLDAREALEMLVPYIKTIICYIESIQDKVNEGCYKKRSRD